MKKRFLCALLTLVMLVSLVPAAALSASAASYSTSESAITILKQMEGYQRTCTNGYIGYGTRCEKCVENKTHDCAEEISEKQADTALRAALKNLDAAINSFASKNGVSMNQNKHDALVLFSFENGTAWTTGTGDFKSAVVAGKTGSDFLDAICRWEISIDDDNRRMIEANMYLHGVYSSSVPYNFIRINYDAGNSPVYGPSFPGSLNGNSNLQYYDTNDDPIPEIIPTMSLHKFLGWYYKNDKDKFILVTEIHSYLKGHTLFARWQPNNAEDGSNNSEVYYEVYPEDLASESAYTYPNGKEMKITLPEKFSADRDYLDEHGNRWVRQAGTNNWVILGESGTYDHPATEEKGVIALAIITYNGYVNVREGAGTSYKIVGSIPKGTEVKVFETNFVNGHEWGRCDIGWFCMTYADVTWLNGNESEDVDGMMAYAFDGTLINHWFFSRPEMPSSWPDQYLLQTVEELGNRVTVTHLKVDNAGNTWGKTSRGWVRISDAAGNPLDVRLDIAKYVVTADSVTVRAEHATSAARVDSLSKGVEFFVNGSKQIVMIGTTIWGYADKAGEFSGENNNGGESASGTNPGVSGPTYGGWVNLDQNHVSRNGAPAASESSGSKNLMATVINTDNVNVRAYTDATYAKVGSLSRGTTVHVWDEEDGWYKIDHNKNGKEEYEDGWVSGQYLNIFENTSSSSSGNGGTGSTGSTNGTVETGLGIVANTYTGVNVRTGAGTGYAAVGKILAGTTVEIQEVKNTGTAKWGRVPQGWVCMDYITMVSHYPVAGSGSNSGSASNGGTGSSNTTTATEAAVYTGFTSREVTVYKTTTSTWDGSTMKINAESVRTLSANSPVTVHELLAVEVVNEDVINGETNHGDINATVTVRGYWARINDGYIFSPGQNIKLNPLDEDTYTVTTVDSKTGYLTVYETAGGAIKDSDDLEKYDTVSVTVLTIVDGSVWCRVEYTNNDGYIRDGYVKIKDLTRGVVSAPVQNTKPNTNTTPNAGNTGAGNLVLGSTGNTANQGTNGFVNNASGYRYTGKVIRTGSVNVRALPSQTATLTTTLKQGAALVIYETTISEGMAWGRCDAGWVYLYYVDLQPCNMAVDAKVVYNENTIAYTDANCSGVAGTYSRMSVVDIYEVVGSMCRTDLGWVHVDNLG